MKNNEKRGDAPWGDKFFNENSNCPYCDDTGIRKDGLGLCSHHTSRKIKLYEKELVAALENLKNCSRCPCSYYIRAIRSYYAN